MNETKKYKVVKPIGWNGRREKNAIVNLTEDEASAFGPEYVIPFKEEEEKVPEESLQEKPLAELSLSELRRLATELKLSITGSKADLVERIELARK